jgi:transposase InsO family protein
MIAGPASIHDYLRFEDWDRVPSVSSIWRALHRRGLISPQPEKRPKSSYRTIVFDRVNECWQIDDTRWRLADGTEVRIVEIIDDHSRTCVASRAAETATSQTAWAVFTEAAQSWGLPAMVLSDNGLAYNGSRRNIEVVFEKNLRLLGINPVASSPYHPQTCGKVERFHQTTKKWLQAQTRANSLSQLNNQLKTFTDYYNHQRPHRSLNGATPGSIHQQDAKAGPANQPITVPKRVTTAHVSTDGSVWSRPWRIAVGRKHAGLEVICIIDSDHAYIFNRNQILRELTLNPNKPNQPLRCPP